MDATVGGASSDSYVSVSYADTFFTNSIDNSAWPTSTAAKEAILIEATRILDTQFDWHGSIATGSTQALRWPREDVYDIDDRLIASDVIPKRIQDAVCNLAYYLLQNGGLKMSDSNLQQVKIGPIDLKFNEDVSVIGIPKYIIKSVQFLGTFIGASQGSIYSVGLYRS